MVRGEISNRDRDCFINNFISKNRNTKYIQLIDFEAINSSPSLFSIILIKYTIQRKINYNFVQKKNVCLLNLALPPITRRAFHCFCQWAPHCGCPELYHGRRLTTNLMGVHDY